MSAPIGIVSPWALIPQLSAWVLLLYVMHASFRIWRKENRQVTQRQSLKIAWARGVTTRIGGSLNTIVIGWQYTWFK